MLDGINSVGIIPSENISVKQIKEGVLNEKEKEKGQNRWIIKLSIDKNAALSKRSLVIDTPNGQTKKKTIEVVGFLPVVSDLKIISVSSGNRIEFSVQVVEAKGEISSNPIVYSAVSCGFKAGIKPSDLINILGNEVVNADNFIMTFGDPNGGAGYIFLRAKITNIINKDAKTSIVHGDLYLKDSRASGNCRLAIQICNDKGYKSNEIETVIKF